MSVSKLSVGGSFGGNAEPLVESRSPESAPGARMGQGISEVWPCEWMFKTGAEAGGSVFGHSARTELRHAWLGVIVRGSRGGALGG